MSVLESIANLPLEVQVVIHRAFHAALDDDGMEATDTTIEYTVGDVFEQAPKLYDAAVAYVCKGYAADYDKFSAHCYNNNLDGTVQAYTDYAVHEVVCGHVLGLIEYRKRQDTDNA